jgi:CheY-like chemotaxis protein
MSEGKSWKAGGGLAGSKILVVEDEAIISFLIEDMLCDLGCAAVWHAGSVGEALALLRVERPDAVLLDVNLGGECAFPVAAQLQATAIPFVFATGYGQKGVPEAWAARPVIQKPFDIDELVITLGAVLTDTAVQPEEQR